MKKITYYLIFLCVMLCSCRSMATVEKSVSPLCKAGYTQQQIDQRLDELWNRFFTPADLSKYQDDGEKSVYYEVNDSMSFIMDTGSNDVRTEGMSYGMMISVQMDKRDVFDKLWRWTKRYMAYASDGPWDGYYCWQCRTDGEQFGESNASDGEIYFATALYIAARKWNEPRYAKEANTLLRKVQEKDPSTGVYPLFDKKTALVTFCPTEEVHWFSDPSYCLPAFLDLWAENADSNNAFWKKAATAARNLLASSSHPVTGLFPDYSYFDGRPYAWPRCAYNSARYQYDAIRCAMNIGMDYYLTGKDSKRQRDIMRRLLRFFDKENYAHGQYDIDGTNPADNYTEGMAGANAVGAIALLDSPDESDQQLAKKYLQRFWETKPAEGKYRYYTGMVYFLSMLHVSGKFNLN